VVSALGEEPGQLLHGDFLVSVLTGAAHKRKPVSLSRFVALFLLR